MKMTLTASLALILSCGSAVAAQNPLTQACAAETQRYCRTIAPIGQASCLQGQAANLSAACKTAVDSQVQAQGNTAGTGTPQQGATPAAAANTAPRGDGY